MKKYALGIIVASVVASSVPVDAQAFLLPPFKIDFSTIANKVLSTTNTISDKANSVQEQSTAVQTLIQYGKGAKELCPIWKRKTTITSIHISTNMRPRLRQGPVAHY